MKLLYVGPDTDKPLMKFLSRRIHVPLENQTYISNFDALPTDLIQYDGLVFVGRQEPVFDGKEELYFDFLDRVIDSHIKVAAVGMHSDLPNENEAIDVIIRNMDRPNKVIRDLEKLFGIS